MEEAAGRLEEHGYFQVVEYKRVGWDEEKEREITQKKEAEKVKSSRSPAQDGGEPRPVPALLPAILERPAYAYVIVARRVERPEKFS